MSYYIEISHAGLNKYRMIRGSDASVVERKAEAQLAAWEEAWERKKARLDSMQRRFEGVEEANQRTREAQEALKALSDILHHTLEIDDKIDWELLKDKKAFPIQRPSDSDIFVQLPQEPDENSVYFAPKFGFLDKLFRGRREKTIEAAKRRFTAAHEEWEIECNQVKERNESIRQIYESKVAEWEIQSKGYYARQARENEAIDLKKRQYLSSDVEAVIEYCDLVLSRSEYPDVVSQDFELDYDRTSKTIIVDFKLPIPDDIPTLKEVQYIKSRDEFKEKHISEREKISLYDSLIYQICLRTIHELFEADAIEAVKAVAFNGWTSFLSPSTGQLTRSCIITIRTEKAEFSRIDLSNVDPKQCFRSLKGVGSAQLSSMSAVAPLMTIDKTDRRFVESYDVAKKLDEGTNLAIMSWEEFEHLVRELFEKEFMASGGEVKVTRASRDGGVDAVAFDPDPIRGGKIVIQAKRYANTVGVSAVRDLYGTLINEGASKGILITTSSYGSDAYEFAKGKPLVLLTGSHLLHLLEKHGYKARIDLKEAKELVR